MQVLAILPNRPPISRPQLGNPERITSFIEQKSKVTDKRFKQTFNKGNFRYLMEEIKFSSEQNYLDGTFFFHKAYTTAVNGYFYFCT